MKVLAFTNLFPHTTQPTLGTFNHDTFVALSKHCEVRVVVPERAWNMLRRPGDILVPRRESTSGLPVLVPAFFSLPGVTPAHALGMAASLHPTLRRLRREFRWDVIVAAWAYPDAVAAAHFARHWGTPLVTVVLGSDLNVVPGDLAVRAQIRWGLSRAARVVAVSRALAQVAMKLGVPPERLVVQHNAVDGERFKPRNREEARRSLGLPAGRPTIGYFGNHRRVKGTDVLIEAMSHLVSGLGNDDALLVLVGDGELTAGLRARVRALGLDSNVRFLGRKTHEELALWMSALDVFCLPSRQEGCPNVVLEALASGRPVVASRVGGVPEILGDSAGALVAPEDPAALAAGIQAALERGWDAEALRASVEYLSWDAVGRRHAEILRAVLAEARESTAGVSPGFRPAG